MKILVLADEESPLLWDYYEPGRLDGVDLILSAGDLKPEYLSFLVTMGRAPLLYVHGNHDGNYATRPPEGCLCIEDRLVTINGVRILGLGGSVQYNKGTHQYTEWQMQRRIARLWPRILLAGGVDIVLTHSPVRGYGDEPDPAHRGFQAFLPLLDRFAPKYLIHGHCHLSYNNKATRTLQYGETRLVNAFGRYLIEDAFDAQPAPKGARRKGAKRG